PEVLADRLPGLRSSLAAPSGASVVPARASRSESDGLVAKRMARGALLKDAGYHLLERRILHAHVEHGVVVEDRFKHRAHARPLDLQISDRALPAGDLAEPAQVVRRRIPGELKLDELRLTELLHDPRQGAV